MSEPTHRRKRDFQCSFCQSSFYHKGHLNTHTKRHLKEKALTCDQCSYATCDSSDLARHVKTVHQKLTPFKCSFSGCNYSTARSGNLKRHHLTHGADPLSRRQLLCDFDGCDYRATQKATLTRHIRSRHNENHEKTFHCSLCPATFYEKVHLRRHIDETHVKQKVHICRKCNYKSTNQSNFNRHLKIVHCDDGQAGKARRPFPCDFRGCDYRAIQKSDLMKHIRRRHNEARVKDFSCSLCPARFYETQDLKKHINEVHCQREDL